MQLDMPTPEWALALTALALTSCGYECHKSDRAGTYIVALGASTGVCSGAGEAITQITDAATDPGLECVRESEQWSDDKCEHESSGTCVDASAQIIIRVAGHTRQEDADGDTIRGVAAVSMSDLDGEFLCQDTYHITYTRLDSK